jgi:hypothetical protein
MMAESRGHGDARTRRSNQGQQAGSKRPADPSGSARPAPKKGDMPAKGTKREGVSKKTRPSG